MEVTKCEWNGKTSYVQTFTDVQNNSSGTITAVTRFDYKVSHKRGNSLIKTLHPIEAVPVRRPDISGGSSSTSCFSDSYTLTGKNWWKKDDHVELAIQTTLDIWKGGGSVGKWSVSGTANYDLPKP